MSHAIDRLHQKLLHVLITWDKAEERAELKRGRRPNIYRMGIYLKAAQDAEAEAEAAVAAGETVERAYTDAVTEHFTPTAWVRTFLRKYVDSTVDVDRGHWVVRGERL
jgi:hypothetical protein